MASAATAVVKRLETVAAVTALVGMRIYQVKLPPKPTLPAIRVQLVGNEEFMHLRGAVKVMRARVQVDSISAEGVAPDPVGQAASVDDAVNGPGDGTGLLGWRGVAGGVKVTAMLPGGLREGYDAQELRQFKKMRDFVVWFER